ncbi:MAG: Rho termination factor N-terminal domain-containing protein [Pseudomonadota bacterium]
MVSWHPRPDQSPAQKGGRAQRCENWTKDELYERAKELDLSGRSKMSKAQLITALRDR